MANNDNDYAFYTQSDLTKLYNVEAGNVDVMILGINPGSSGSYTGQKNKGGWHLHGNDMTGEMFLNGNYFTEENKKSAWECREDWAYWKRLLAFFEKCKTNPLKDETKFVLTNMCYFNTPKANQIPIRLLEVTKVYTIDLIDIIKPKRLVFLSGKSALQRLNILKEFSPLGSNVYVGKYLGIPCLGVPHPSAYLSGAEREFISETIATFMNSGTDIDALS